MSNQYPDPHAHQPQEPTAPQHGTQGHYGQEQYGAPSPYAAPATSLSPAEERNLAMLSHAIPLAATVFSAGTLGFVGSLILYIMYKDRGPFVRANAANSLNVQIMTGIVLLISFPLMLVLVGFLTYGLALVFAVVLHAIGAIKANNGEWWQPPMTPRFVS